MLKWAKNFHWNSSDTGKKWFLFVSAIFHLVCGRLEKCAQGRGRGVNFFLCEFSIDFYQTWLGSRNRNLRRGEFLNFFFRRTCRASLFELTTRKKILIISRVFYSYQNWKKKLKRQLAPDGMTTVKNVENFCKVWESPKSTRNVF